MAKVTGSNKKTMGSIRAKAGLPAKAGKRRPPHIHSKWEERTIKVDGKRVVERKRHWYSGRKAA